MYPVTRWIWVIGLCLAVMVGCGGGEQPKVVDQQVVKQSDVGKEEKQPEADASTEEGKKVRDALPLFVKIEPGTFMMGSPADGPDKDVRDDDERQHTVTISTGFWIASHEVTQELYYAVMRTNPSSFTDKKYCPAHHVVYNDNSGKAVPVCKNLPVEQVSWNGAQNFITALNKIDNKGYRLPTEAEWEYAVRGGDTGKDKRYTVYSFGDGIAYLDEHAWYRGRSLGPQPVGGNRPLKIGEGELYDMHGNVMEWVQDWYGDSTVAVTDPKVPQEGYLRVIRGGGWISSARDCRSANRDSGTLIGRSDALGFRLVRTSQ